MDAVNPVALSHIEHGHMPTIASSFRPPPLRCTECNVRPIENGRNLIVCIDGTANAFGENNTNIVKLFAKIDLETTLPKQFTYYSSGIGTRSRSSHIVNRIKRAVSNTIDMAFAWNIEEIVKDAYGWLARTYQEGDQIYLFGFSRGAYQVRVLACMIREIGLIRTPTEKQIETAYDHYESIRSGTPQMRKIAREFKTTFSWNLTRVHFVGVWDTVSSVGLGRGDVFLSTSSSAAYVCYFRHALALDELRVKFMPEYFHEMNSREIPPDEHVTSSPSERRESTASDNGTDLSGGKKNKIKEVWFAGSHSDVGGMNRPGKSHQAGNISLLWMRREAVANGLVLRPSDIVWMPDDLDFGTSNSMTRPWWMVEYLPITHQVSFSADADGNKRRLHRLQPRRIIPGQKIHASILYANTYKPRASLGEGFEIPIVHPGLDTKLDSRLWETGVLFDAQEIVACLGDQQGVAPKYLDRLLFILRFQEGKQCVRNVPDWQSQFLHAIHDRDCTPLVRLVAIVAYYEASCEPDTQPESLARPPVELSPEIFHFAAKSFGAVLAVHKYRDLRRVISLLRPLTKHQILREHILTQNVLETFVDLLDTIIHETGENIHQAMDGLTSLLQCKDTQGFIIKRLEENLPPSNVIRLSRILDIKDPHLLTAVLRMVITLARIPEGKPVCLTMKPRLMELAKTDERLVGVLSVEILLVICKSSEHEQEPRSIRNANVRANVAGALIRLSPDNRDPADGEERDAYPGLRHLFGVDAAELTERHKRLIKRLKGDIQQSNVRKRTVATLAVLNLCSTEIIRTFLCEIDLLDVFINQMRCKDSALLAAYALSICLKYNDMKQSIQNNKLPKNIVDMCRLDYFDDAVGQIKGFQIFKDFMGDGNLRQRIKDQKIIEVLNTKLVKGKPKETRTGLICLDILCASSGDGLLHRELVAKSLDCLRSPVRNAQNAGVEILCALAQTERGVAIIRPRICDIIEMLLPDDGDFRVIWMTTKSATLSSDKEQIPITSQMMGPARALHALAENETLRKATRSTNEYSALKYRYLSAVYMDKTSTSLWRSNGLNHAVVDLLGKMIKRIDSDEAS